jgi:integrase
MVSWADREPLSRDPLVAAWLGGYRKSSVRFYLWIMVLALGGEDRPEDLLRLNVDRELRQRVIDRARAIRDKGKLGTAPRVFSTVSSFCGYHGVDVKWRRGETIRSVPVRVHVQHIPSRAEVYKMADVAGLRNRAVILCLYQSGVRANCLSRWDMPLCGAIMEKAVMTPYPLRITDRYDTKISSYGMNYYVTFLGAEAVSALRDWLKYRIVKGWVPGDKSMVWGNSRAPRAEASIGIHQLDMIVRGVAEKIGISQGTIWTHLLRKSFQKSLNQANIDEDTKESLMGHVLPGSRGNYFDYTDENEIREKYSRVPLSRESPAELNDLRKEVEELRRTNERLEHRIGDGLQGWGDSLERGRDKDRELMEKKEAQDRVFMATIEGLRKRVEELERRHSSG